MTRSIFGWSLPPGVSMRHIDPPEEPCLICGNDLEVDCICPECPICYTYGDPYCYIHHGLRRTEEQKFSLEVNERNWEEDAKAEADYWKNYVEDWEEERNETKK